MICYRLVVIALFFALMIVPEAVQAQIPRTLSYQGVLTDSAGNNPREGQLMMSFRLYDGTTKIWEETKSVLVRKGLFSTMLGDVSPIGAGVTFDRPYTLGIQIGNEPELSPRTQLSSVGYSLNAARADTARVSMSSIDTVVSSFHIVGTPASNRAHLSIGDPLATSGQVSSRITLAGSGIEHAGFAWVPNVNPSLGLLYLAFGGSDNPMLNTPRAIYRSDGTAHFLGSVKVYDPLYPTGNSFLTSDANGGRFQLTDAMPAAAGLVQSYIASGMGMLKLQDRNNNRMEFQGIGRMYCYKNGVQTVSVDGYSGLITTPVLAITGGSDLAEPFEISETELLPPGTVVVIDRDNEGKLKRATMPYDKRVAGVISGAGGVNPGLTLAQEGTFEKGQHVALSGKVFVLATAAKGPIEPGDLLTSSDVPGHAMKASDPSCLHGAILGKAMSRLQKGEGLVLVLVSLQ